MIYSRYIFPTNYDVVVECEWSEWQLERSCSVTCGGGKAIYTRNKTLTDSLMSRGHLSCEMKGARSENSGRDCNTNCCKGDGNYYYISYFIESVNNPMLNHTYSEFVIFAVDCNWSNWGSWKSCEDRFKNEHRLRIKDPNGYENCKGKDCEGDHIEERPCRGIFNLYGD